jgi:charged multivesicular body protein 5
LDALGDELEFEEEEIPSYLQEEELDLPKVSETDPKLVSFSKYQAKQFVFLN